MDWGVGGASALSLHAPHAAEAFTRLLRLHPRGLDSGSFETMRAATADAVALTPLLGSRVLDVPDPDVVAFAEQFAVDVATLRHSARVAWGREMGERMVTATQMLYVADYGPRVKAALDQIFGLDEWFEPPLEPVDDPAADLEMFLTRVAVLDALDPITSELIRLRCARQHRHRVEMGRRSIEALRAGADAETFIALDYYRSSDLTDLAKAALGLVDAMIHTPASIRESDLEAVQEHLTPAQAVEVVLDIARHGAHKVAVALGESGTPGAGVELFAIDEQGRVVLP